ncbi:response regulator transcription factor [Candidatus Calescamantes bacterium]|nr:response regulator transcription factor [Candidatus Calescamantes bacterium]
MNELIFVVDDEIDILELVSLHLKRASFKVKEFQDGSSFLSAIEHQVPDLVILDLMLPDADGFEICKYLRKREDFSSLPIIILTAKGEETDRVLGLELGADDYVTKPFSPRELVARVKAVLRRKGEKEESAQVKIGDILMMDLQKYQTTVEGKRVELTPTEFRILKILSLKKGRVFTRNQILDYLWGDEKAVLDRTIDVHIKNIREKLGKAGKFIKSIRGVGYKLED